MRGSESRGQSDRDFRGLPGPIREKLQEVIERSRRDTLVRTVALTMVLGFSALILLIAADAMFGLRWAPIRWAIWISATGTAAGLVWHGISRSRQHRDQLLHAAWDIDSAHPEMEERLTSTVQFLMGDSTHGYGSLQLIDALAAETADGVAVMNVDSISAKSLQWPIAAAATLVATFAILFALWPRQVLESLGYLMAPWSAHAVPALAAQISSGDNPVARGDSVKIEIVMPRLRRLAMPRDGVLPIHYRASDVFGVPAMELIAQFDQQSPVVTSIPGPELSDVDNEGGLGDQRIWSGTTSMDLSVVPNDCQQVSLWLRIADNRPERLGGSQFAESEKIQVHFDDGADCLGKQQIEADRKFVEQSLEQALQKLRAAHEAAGRLHRQLDDSGSQSDKEQPHNPIAKQPEGSEPADGDEKYTLSEDVPALRQGIQDAKESLDELAKEMQEDANLFGPSAEQVQHISNQQVAEALEHANQIPLYDDRVRQVDHAQNGQQHLAEAIDQLERIRSDIEQRARQMERAAELDQLAMEQERLAHQARQQTETAQEEAPEESWRDRQANVANDLQALVEKKQSAANPDARDRRPAGENDPADPTQLAKATDSAQRAANSDSARKAAQYARQAAQQLSQLADQAAQKSGYACRSSSCRAEGGDRQQASSNRPQGDSTGRPGLQPSIHSNRNEPSPYDANVCGQTLRGDSTSNWTRSRRKLDGGLLDDRGGNVPEEFREVVQQYFEELSRQQSRQDK